MSTRNTPNVDSLSVLLRHATGNVQHANRGTCPDGIEGFDSRDPECPACSELDAAYADLAARIGPAVPPCAAERDRLIDALSDLRVGVGMDAQHLVDAAAKLEGLDVAIAMLRSAGH